MQPYGKKNSHRYCDDACCYTDCPRRKPTRGVLRQKRAAKKSARHKVKIDLKGSKTDL